MPMVADSPSAYAGQTGFDFIRQVPTTWDETRFLAGQAGEYIVIARRQARAWYLGGITNWTPRKVEVPLDFLASGDFEAHVYVDGSQDEAYPNEVRSIRHRVNRATNFSMAMAPGGGFVAVLSTE